MKNIFSLQYRPRLRRKGLLWLLTLLIVHSTALSESPEKFNKFVWTSAEMNGKVYEKAAVLVPVTIAGTSKKLYAQLDTGADLTIFYGHILSSLGIPFDSAGGEGPVFRWYGRGGEESPPERPEIINWSMGADYDPEKIERDYHIVGTIGLDKVIGKILVLDFPGERFAVLNDTAAIENILPAPVSYVDGSIAYNKFYVDVQLGGDTISSVRYDCGSSMGTLILPRDLWQRVTGLNGDEPEVVKDSVRSWGNYVDILSAPAQGDMVFADIRLAHPEVMTVDWPDPTLAQMKLLGNAPFYDSLVVVVDCIREKFGICRGF